MSIEPNLEAIVRALHGKPSGGQYITKCCAHHDEHASLSLGKPNGKIVFKCHAGCRDPRPVKIGARASAWRAEEIRALIETLRQHAAHGTVPGACPT
jgi:hypothetical protein